MKEYLSYRLWDIKAKKMGVVYSLIYANTPPTIDQIMANVDSRTNGYSLKSDALFPGVLMMSTGLKDNNKVPIFEDDVLEIDIPHHLSGWPVKIRGRVVWNPNLTYGEYGFVIVDQDSGIHPFRAVDSMVVVGNFYEGIK